MVFLLPILMVILPLFLLLTLATPVLKEQSLQNFQHQSDGLNTLMQMATFDRQRSDLQQRITVVLSRATASDLGTMQLYC